MKLIITLLLLTTPVFAANANLVCGEYKISGVARMIKNTPYLVINEHTLSEYILSLPISEEPKIAPYINRPFELTALIEKKFNGTKGQIKSLKGITHRIPNPLGQQPDTGLKLIKKITCVK